MVSFVVAPDLRSIVTPGVLIVENARIVEDDAALHARLTEAEAAVRARRLEPSALVRAMYRRTGLDPTRRRPSSEALLRRVLKGEPLPRINTAVDICNWCSLEFQLPYGLYDLDRVEGGVILRYGGEGESYPGIRKDDVHVAGRMTLADDRGPFGNPTSDSARTQVTTATTRILTVVFSPADFPRPELERVLDLTSGRLREFTGAAERHRAIV
ncbi:MAG TPA: phenylalanine--tRNA ligase beta subunit-related protein [Vicinamibacterales bacterium]|nr:phenylalanine--tRNA ligase beta subunit-related protein [Vicinamibacterales bacterium]